MCRGSPATPARGCLYSRRRESALGWLHLAAGTANFMLQLINSDLALQVPDLDADACGSTEPVAIRVEAQGVDDVPTIKCTKVLAFTEVPQHGLAIPDFRNVGRSIWRDSHGVQIPCVADGIGLQLAVCQAPLLDQLVPATGHDGVAAVG